jgi:membrane protein
MNPTHVFDSAKQAASDWVDDRAASMGAALSYYTVFSIAPLLVIVIAVAGLVFGAEAARGAIADQLQGLLGEQAARTIQEVLANVSEPKTSAFATAIGFVLLLVGATTVFAELQDDLDRIWKVPQRAKPKGAWGWIRARMLSFGMVLAIGFLLLVSLVASAAISAVGAWGGGLFGAWETVAHVVEVVVSFGLLAALFAVMYRFLPDVRIAWHDVWVGAIATALLFTVGKFLIGLYIGKSSTASTFGAAGSLVVLLLWVYYSAQIFLFGAEFTAAYSHAYGSRRAQAATETGAAPGIEPTQEARPSTGGAPLSTGQPAVAATRQAAAPSTGQPAVAATRQAAAPSTGQPMVAATRQAAAQAMAIAPSAVAVPAPHGITAPIARYPARAIGVAAGLGAVTALLLQRQQRAHAPEARGTRGARGAQAARQAAAPPRSRGRAALGPPAGRIIAKAVTSALVAVVTRALAERLKRGARRGWRTGKERAA